MGRKRRLAALVLALALLAGPAPAGAVRAACWVAGGSAWARLENRGAGAARVELELWLDRGGWRQNLWAGELGAGESRTLCLGRAESVRPGRLEVRGIFRGRDA